MNKLDTVYQRSLESKHFWALIIITVNLLQAVFTNIHDDEAYYWLFSENLNWGFFDHPPMVALFIKFSNLLFQGNLSIRFFTIILSVLNWYLVLHLVLNKSIKWLALSYLSLPIFQLYGFITTPDVPLISFGLLFLIALKRLLDEKKGSWAFLGITMALLAYSKYHGALIVLFALLPIINKQNILKIAAAGILALVLFLPHLWWQTANNWPSFSYHLVSRHKGFSLAYFFEFLLAIFIVPSIFIFWLKKTDTGSNLKKSLKWVFWGFLLFFGFMLTKGKIEIHWLAFGGVAAFLLALSGNLLKTKWFKGLIISQLVLITIARIALPTVGNSYFKSFEKGKQWALEIESVSDNLPVVFMNSFQQASKYQFYTGQISWSDNNRFLRKNQFDLWKHDTILHNKTIYYVSNYNHGGFITDSLSVGFGGRIDSFLPVQRLKGTFTEVRLEKVDSTLTFNATLKINNPYSYSIQLKNNSMPMRFYAWFITDSLNKVYKLHYTEKPVYTVSPGDNSYRLSLKTKHPVFVNREDLEIGPILMKGELYGQTLGETKTYQVVKKD